MPAIEQEQQEQNVYGIFHQWQVWHTVHGHVAGLSTAQWNAAWDALQAARPGTAEVTQAQALGFLDTRRARAFTELLDVINRWRLTP